MPEFEPVQFPVDFDVDESGLVHLERQLSNTADRLQELAREQALVNTEIAKAKEAGQPYAELEARLKGIGAETQRNMGIMQQQQGTYEATATGGISAFAKVGIAMATLRWGLKAAQYGVQELELRFDRLRKITGGRLTANLRHLNERIDSIDTALGLARTTVTALRIAMAVGGAAITAYSATMAFSIGKIKAWSKELNILEKNALLTGESMQDMSEIMRASAAQGLDLGPGAFRQFAELRAKALQDATSEPAMAYAELGVTPGASLGEVTDALAGVNNELDRGQLAMAIFGKEAGATIALLDGLSDAEKNANAARIAATREVQAAGDVWRRVGQAMGDIPKGFLANAVPEVKRFGEALLPILQDMRLWVTYSPAVREFIGLIELTGDVIAKTVGFFRGSTAKQREYLATLDQMQLEFAQRQDEAMRQWKRDMASVDLTSDATKDQAEAAGKSANVAEAINRMLDNSDNVLRSILPTIECGAEAMAEMGPEAAKPIAMNQLGGVGTAPYGPIINMAEHLALEQEREVIRQAEVDTQLVVAGINPETGATFASEQGAGDKLLSSLKSLLMIGGNPIDVAMGIANQPQLQSRNVLNPERINPQQIPIGAERTEPDSALQRWYRGERVGPIPGAYQLDVGPAMDFVSGGINLANRGIGTAQSGVQGVMNWGWDRLGMERKDFWNEPPGASPNLAIPQISAEQEDAQRIFDTGNAQAFGPATETIYYDNSVHDAGDTKIDVRIDVSGESGRQIGQEIGDGILDVMDRQPAGGSR